MSTKTLPILALALLIPAAGAASAAENAGAQSIEHVLRRTVAIAGAETVGALDPD